MFKLSIKRPVTTVMIMMIAILAGVVSLMGLKLDLMPNVNIPIAIVSTTYIGAGPEEIETLITKPIEGALGTVSNVDTLTSTSSSNSSMVMIQFVDGTDVDMAAIDLREKIDMVKSSLPEGAGDPMVLKMDPSMLSAIQVGIHSDMDLEKLTDFLDEKIISQLERIEGVASVSTVGSVVKEIQVILSPEKMQGYNVTAQQISGLLQAENLNMPAGQIAQGGLELQLRTVGQFQSVDEIRELPIPTQTGAVLHLSDVAQVNEVNKTDSSYALIDGQKSIILTVQKQSNANTVDISDKVNAALAKMQKQYPELKMTTLTNTSDYIKTSLNNVLSTAVQAAIMAVIVLFLFLRNGRASMIIAVSIPTSIIVTFGLMYVNNMTLNTISLGGLTIGIGMLVDNSVVVLEAISRHYDSGLDAKQAAKVGAAEVAMSVTASTLTTVAVFIPLMFVTGMIGQMFKDLSLTVSFSLIVSLVVSLTFVPMACAYLLRHEKEQHKSRIMGKFLDGWRRGLDGIDKGYSRLLNFALDHKKSVVAIVLAAFIASMALIPAVGLDLMPAMDQGSISINVEMPKGAILEETSKTVEQVMKRMDSVPETKEWYALVGSSGFGSSSDTATVVLNLVDKKSRTRSSKEVADSLQTELNKIPGAKITASAASSAMGSFGSSADIQVQLNGDDTEQLRRISNDLVDELNAQTWAENAVSSLADAVPEASIRIDRVKASTYGITAGSIASALSTAVTGSTPTQYKVNGNEIDVKIMQDKNQIRYVSDLSNITVPSAMGTPVPLTEVAEIVISDGATQINRINQHRYITVSASSKGIDTNTARTNLETMLKSYNFPDGYSYEFTGDLDSLIETFASLLLVLLVAILLVYMIMAAQFESFIHPLIIMFSLPLALTGAVLGLFITRNTITATAFMGFIMLVGTVVNNAIVLVDYANQLMASGMNCRDALVKAGPTRLRPILMTTLTTVLGLVPMAVSTAEGTEMQRPLAISVMFGLALSTVVTLVFIPVLYAWVDKRRHKKKKKSGRKQFREGYRGAAVPENGSLSEQDVLLLENGSQAEKEPALPLK